MSVPFKVTIEVSRADVYMMITTAMEGPFMGWCSHTEVELPEAWDVHFLGAFFKKPNGAPIWPSYAAPLSGGALIIYEDAEPGEPCEGYRLDEEAIGRGLALLYQNIDTGRIEDADSEVAAAFIQYAIFGEERYS